MLRREYFRWLGQAGSAGVLGAILAASVAEASLPTGGMLLPRPRGPSRADLPAPTSISVYRVPSATAYGMNGNSSTAAIGDQVAVQADPFAFAASPTTPNEAQPEPDAFRTPDATRNAASEEHPLILPRGTVAAATAFAEESFAGPPAPTGDDGFGSTVAALPDEWVNEPASNGSSDTYFAGLKGICPVTLRDERRVVTPQTTLFVEFEGRRYEFATAEAKAAFEADPEKYAPVLGGRDVVLTSMGAHDAVGSLKHAGVYRERLYLFQSEDTCQTFYGNPRRYVVGE